MSARPSYTIQDMPPGELLTVAAAYCLPAFVLIVLGYWVWYRWDQWRAARLAALDHRFRGGP